MARVAYARRLTLAAAVVAACSAGGGGAKIDGSGTSGGAAGSGISGVGGTTGGIIDPGAGGSTDGSTACQQYDVNFEPRTPTVFVLVDRSGTMFDVSGTTNAWDPLRDSVLQVIERLQARTRFGFGAFTGEIGQTCPIFDEVAPEVNNYEAIRTVYSGLGKPAKGETPAVLGLQRAREALVNDAGTGSKYILFVTDGEPDYCSDGDGVCPVDSVAFHLQRIYAEGFQTLILGLTTTAVPVPEGGLEAWANAGRGQPVAIFKHRDGRTITPVTIYDECNSKAPWQADAALDGGRTDRNAPNPALVAYTSPGGNAPVYRPGSLNIDALTNEISAAIQGAKSCKFDLQGKIKVNLARQSEGSEVLIGDQPVPFDELNGWHMTTETELVLEGAACETWRAWERGDIHFKFPCEIIIPPPA
jgi:hypothetical protein